MELRIHLSSTPTRELKSLGANLSESQFVNLGEEYAKKYGITSSEPLIISRSQTGNLNDAIVSDSRWLMDSRSGAIYDLEKIQIFPNIKLNGVDVPTNNVILNFTFDSKAVIWNEKDKRIVYINYITNLPFTLNSTSDRKVPETGIALLRNFMGKYFLYYQPGANINYYIIYEWTNGNMIVISKYSSNSNDRLNQLQYGLYLRLNKWSNNLMGKIDQLAALIINDNPINIFHFKVSDDDQYAYLNYSFANGAYNIIVNINTMQLVDKWDWNQGVTHVEWFHNTLVIYGKTYDSVYLVSTNINQRYSKNANEHFIYGFVNGKVSPILKFLNTTNNQALSISRLSNNHYLIYLNKDVSSYPQINITTIDNKPYYSSNNTSMVLIDVDKGKANSIDTDLSGGRLIGTINGWIFETSTKLYIFNNRNGALKHFGFSGVNTFVSKSQYESGLKQLYAAFKQSVVSPLITPPLQTTTMRPISPVSQRPTTSTQPTTAYVSGIGAGLKWIPGEGDMATQLRMGYVVEAKTPEEQKRRMMNFYDLALNDLKTFINTNTSLNITNNDDLFKITKLDMYNKNITQIPPAIGLLGENLKELLLKHNKLTKLPNDITGLENLEVLDVGENQLIELPKRIGNMVNLVELYADNNNIDEIPKSIGNLTRLDIFYINNNSLTQLPDEITTLYNLRTFNMSNNKITNISPQIKIYLNKIPTIAQ